MSQLRGVSKFSVLLSDGLDNWLFLGNEDAAVDLSFDSNETVPIVSALSGLDWDLRSLEGKTIVKLAEFLGGTVSSIEVYGIDESLGYKTRMELGGAAIDSVNPITGIQSMTKETRLDVCDELFEPVSLFEERYGTKLHFSELNPPTDTPGLGLYPDVALKPGAYRKVEIAPNPFWMAMPARAVGPLSDIPQFSREEEFVFITLNFEIDGHNYLAPLYDSEAYFVLDKYKSSSEHARALFEGFSQTGLLENRHTCASTMTATLAGDRIEEAFIDIDRRSCRSLSVNEKTYEILGADFSYLGLEGGEKLAFPSLGGLVAACLSDVTELNIREIDHRCPDIYI